MSLLNFHDLGDPNGEPVLAIHGITAHGMRFRRLAEEAWPHRRTIAVDLRGHGRSTFDGPWSIPQHLTDLLDTLDALDIAQIDVLGHSYGGAIGLALLAHTPSRVRRLALLDPAMARTGAAASEAAIGTIEQGGWETIEAATRDRNDGLGTEIHPAVIEDVEQHLQRDSDGLFRFRYHKPAVVTGWGEMSYPLPSVISPCPTLVMIAEQADFVSPEIETQLASLLAGHITTKRIDCGHMLYWERFDETAEALLSFWNSTSN